MGDSAGDVLCSGVRQALLAEKEARKAARDESRVVLIGHGTVLLQREPRLVRLVNGSAIRFGSACYPIHFIGDLS